MQEEEKLSPIPQPELSGDVRAGLSVGTVRQSVLDNLRLRLAKVPQTATLNDWYLALAFTVRDRMIKGWIKTLQSFTEDVTVIAYLSAEFLMGPQLGINLINLCIRDEVSQAVKELGLNLDELIEQEKEPGLGNASVGRLAACCMDSLATLGLPAIGYGIRYEFGGFCQEIREGWQVEMTDKWLSSGNPWEIRRPEMTYNVCLGGRTESYYDEQDSFRVRWIPKFSIKGTAYDTPVSGYKVAATNLLRLWKSEAIESFDFEAFKSGDYFGALTEKIASESIGKILYPDNEPYAGKQLRLAQQYFSVSCALQDMIRLHLLRWKNIHTLSDSFAVQLNDTQPAIAVAELMRLLVDEHLVSWDKAWYITQNTFSYTMHAILPEALEKWPSSVFAGILPRHLEIINEINRRFLDEIWLRYPDNNNTLSRFSVVDESDQKYVRMERLASLGSHAVTGISEVHSELLKKTLLPDLYEIYPERFLNITAGVTQRRWVALSNPRLAGLVTSVIGDSWISRPEEMKRLEAFADEPGFIEKWRKIKFENKNYLADIIHDRIGVSVDPDSLFDVQIKRIHEYNRQHLNILHIITLFAGIKRDPQIDIVPRTFIFGGKASPGDSRAKLIIKLINSVAEAVNNDDDAAGRLKIVFFPDFNVKNAQKIYPAADLSEQIASAEREASGTGSMKLSMNGAMTIGTPGGVNAEIRKEMGEDNFFLFGLTAEEVYNMKSQAYNPKDYYADADLKEVIDLIGSGVFSKRDTGLFKPLVDSLLCRDEPMVLADYRSYIECQNRVGAAFKDQKRWTRMSVLIASRMGKFSSDRVIREYNEKIWHASPLNIDLENDL